MSGYVISSLICAIAWNIHILIWGRILQAALGCASLVICYAVVKDYYDEKSSNKYIGYLSALMGFALAVAPVIGGYLTTYINWQANFYLLGFVGLITVVLIVFLLPETNQNKTYHFDIKVISKSYLDLLKNKRYVFYVTCLGFAFGGQFFYVVAAPFILISKLHVPVSQFAYYFIFNAYSFILGSYIATVLQKKIHIDIVLCIAITISVFSAIILTLASYMMSPISPVVLVAIMFFVTLGVAMSIPPCVSGAINLFPKSIGTASAGANFMEFGGSFIAGLIVSSFSLHPIHYMSVAMLIAEIFAFVCMLFLVVNKKIQ